MPVIMDINLLSRLLYEEIWDSGDLGEFHMERKGLLMMYQTKKERDHEREVAERAKELGLTVHHLDLDGLRILEPHVELNAKGAFHYESDWHTTPHQIMERMLVHLLKKGVDVRKNEEVLNVSGSGHKITGVKTDKNFYEADELVLAAGSWTSRLSKKMGIKLPLQAGKGYRINVETPTQISMPAILMEAKMAVTPMDGFTRFAGTMEFSGINNTIRKQRVEAIAQGACNYYKGLRISESDKKNAQCGLRPVTPDGLPYIGTSSKYENLHLATGHAMMGWSLGPATGKLITELISGTKPSMDIGSFAPERKF